MRAGMDAAVLQQLLERQAGDLAAHAVEAREDHGVRRVVDDEVDAGEVLEGADVAALAADDAALHVVGRQLDDRDRRLGRVAGGEALHDDREDVAHAPVGLALGLLLDLAHHPRAVVADLVGQLLEQQLLGLRRAHAGDPLELADVAVADVVDLLLAGAQALLALGEAVEARVERLLLGEQLLLEADDLGAALLEIALDRLGCRRPGAPWTRGARKTARLPPCAAGAGRAAWRRRSCPPRAPRRPPRPRSRCP